MFRALACFVTIGVLLLSSVVSAAEPPGNAAVADAANRFLATLTEGQKQRVIFPYDDASQRTRWSNFPTGFVPRSGISIKEMNPQQKTALFGLLKAVLSPMGFEKVDEIRRADDDFRDNGSKRGPPGAPPSGGSAPSGSPPPAGAFPDPTKGFPGPPPRPIAGRPPLNSEMFGSDLYYISFLGKPSPTLPWMLQFGGHHLALNVSTLGGNSVMTPSLTGAQPATFKLNGVTLRPLGRESDKALVLLQSLDSAQRERAVLKYTVADLVLGPGQDGKRISPEGLPASALNDRQKSLLLDVISEWAGIMNKQAATARMAQLQADLNQTWFAWSGPLEQTAGTNITAYYRIQGPHLVIEYAPQRDEPSNHVHTIYRDPTNDYNRQFAPAP